ncbi:glycosyltransferase [Streptomyces albipurpureus]|uniref:D-inositol 3-phosphate glycosyltransferase n=1 Tax=Streptomyces albipurpureus TaxID=2897419 RepID=A0ABT0UXI4_9ACTN|nr:glycosyltransferase [Streptomyces sp. CWNU-1]MCM2393288.1 glycosyltransferase [Streptomyces sp. CWNU-1]
MSTSVTRPKLAVIVANGITGDSRVQKTALAAARAGWDVTLIGRSTAKKAEHSWFGPVKVVRLPVGNRMERLVTAKNNRGGPRARLTQFGIRDGENLNQMRDAHRAWVREKTTRIGYLSDSPVAGATVAGLKAWVHARRSAHQFRVKAYRWEQRRKSQKTTGDWREDWPALLDLDLAFGPFIEELAPDVIHANDITMIHTAARAASRLRARGLKCSWLYDSHEYVAGIEWAKPAMRTAFPAVEREFIGRADAVVTVSPELAEMLRADHKLSRTPAVVRNAPIRSVVGDAVGRVSVRTACGLDEGVPLMVYAGWIAPDRGVATAVEALVQLPEHHLALVSGRVTAGLTALRELAAELGVRDRVHVVPYVPQHEVPDYLSSADLGLTPFHRIPNVESSLPTKAAEYLHARLPIITSDIKAMSEFVRVHGVGEVFTAEDTESFVAAVKRATTDHDALQRSINEALLTDLSWEHQAEVLLKVYTEISGKAPAEPLTGMRWDAEERKVASPSAKKLEDLDRAWRPLGPTPIKLGLAPANYAGQLASYATAITRMRDDVSAEVVKHRAPTQKHDYPADVYFDVAALRNLDVQLELVQRTVRRYTHLIADAFRPVFGGLNGGSIEGDLAALEHARIKVALLAHGSEVRDPARHRKRNPYSLFLDAPDGYEETLTTLAVRNRRIAEEAGLPVFVTTPDLLLDLPMATWAPLVVDLDMWACDRPVMERKRPVVVHAPSARWSKGTDRVLPLLEDLNARGVIDFQLAENVAWSRVRELVMDADIVIDQFAIGAYGTFACEGMAAGKPVIAYLDEESIAASGVTPPIVNATPQTLASVMERLLDDPEATARIGRESADYVREYHDGTATVAALDSFLTKRA